MGYTAAAEDGRCGEDRVDSAPSRRAIIVGSILLAFCCAAVAAQGISGGLGEERGLGSPSELLYIDSNGEKQHIHVDNFIGRTQDRATSPPAVAAKAAAAARVAKKKEAALSGPSSEGRGGKDGYDDAPILDALAEHENRDKKVDMKLKAMHQKPAPQKIWHTKKWDSDDIHAMPAVHGTQLESAAAWYRNIVDKANEPHLAREQQLAARARSAQAQLRAKVHQDRRRSVLEEQVDYEDGDHNVFGGL